MKKIPIKIVSTQDHDTLQIRFFPTDICNFNCSYCWPGSGNVNKFRYPKNINTVIKNFKTLFDQYIKKLNKNKFHLIIIGGGEPTMWPYVEQFCKELKESHNVYITICSNGSRTVRWWESNSKYFDDVILSCHSEFVDINHYVKVGDVLFNAGLKVTGSVVMDAKNWSKCVENIEYIKSKSKYPWFIEAKAVVDAPGHDMSSYSKEQLEYLKDGIKRLPDSTWLLKRLADIRTHESIVLFNDGSAQAARPHDIVVNKWTNFKGWKCNVAFETLLISYDGSVKGSCQEPVFAGKDFNIFEENFSEDFTLDVNFKPISCPKDHCLCQPETHITKSL